MCFSSPDIPDPIPPAPPVPMIQAPVLDASKDSTINQMAKRRLGKKALQIPLVKSPQTGLAIPTA
jgi:hypothetical protein